jgi:hypothetical protein
MPFETNKKNMKQNIIMGNEEFILYIRKKSKVCSIANDQLGKIIWNWLQSKGATKIEEDKPCLWGKFADKVDELGLPKTATQFEFDRALLPELFSHLDELSDI